MISFRVYGEPKAQPRVRAAVRFVGKRPVARVYDPGSAEGWKGAIALAAREFRPRTPIAGPVRLDLTMYFKRPQKFRTRKFPVAAFPHTSKPDRDNCDKAVMDVLTALGFWADDRQVCDGRIVKLWEGMDAQPGALIEIAEIESIPETRATKPEMELPT